MAAVLVAAACANLDGLSGGPPSGPDAGEGAASPGLSISARALDFTVDCASGVAPSAQNVVLRNDTDTAQRYELSVEGPFALSEPAMGEVPPRAERSVGVTLGDLIDEVQTGALRIRQGSLEDIVSLEARADGPRLEVSPANADFGFVRATVGSALELTFHNPGTRSLPVAFELPSDLVLEGPGTIAAGATAKGTLTMRAGAVGTVTATGTLAPVVGLCGAAPSLAIRGERVSANVIAGPGTVDFGEVGCRTTPTATATVTLSNYSPQGLTYNTSIEGPHASLFRIVGPASGGLPGAPGATPSNATVTVALNAPGGSFGDKTATLRFPGTTEASVTLRARVVGAEIAYDQDLLEFDRNQSRSTRLRNTGNQSACVGYTFAPGDAAFSLGRESDPVPAGGSGWTNVKFEASGSQPHDATIVTSSIACTPSELPTPLCSDAPRLRLKGKR